MHKPVIQVRGLGKRYQLGATLSADTLRDHIMHGLARVAGRHPARRETTEFWALRDVDFDVRDGDVLGVIGANGAGKSTLLKILTGITDPTCGEVRTRGRVASLLEVGTGFHPELSGRENIHLNGAILGMTRREIKARFDEIVDFAGVEKFLETPVKRYSSGMRVRLGFAVAAHLEPEILLIDEVLAVGDVAFQQKCMGKMGEVAGHGRTVIFVSHNMAAVESLCPRAILLEGGRLTQQGPTHAIVNHYLAGVYRGDRGDGVSAAAYRATGADAGPVASVTLRNAQQDPAEMLRAGDACSFHVELESTERLPALALGLHLKNESGQRVTSFHTRYQPCPPLDLEARMTLVCACPELMLAPGRYILELALVAGGRMLAHLEPCLTFHVIEADVFGTGKLPPPKDGVLLSRGTWTRVRA